MGWCYMYPRLYQQAVSFFISALTWRDLVAVETGENKVVALGPPYFALSLIAILQDSVNRQHQTHVLFIITHLWLTALPRSTM